jgi:NMD protein affecting ribosome stability and mRNA decay
MHARALREVVLKSRQPKKEKAGQRGGRITATRGERQGDTYRRKVQKVEVKAPDLTVCPDCKAVFRGGRWRWAAVARPSGTRREVCPACRRIRDGYPAGEVTIRGEFARAHRDELVARVRNLERKEKSRRPLNRLMEIREVDDALVVTTTDTHLAHAIGSALFQSYRGTLHSPWAEEGDLLRVSWER